MSTFLLILQEKRERKGVLKITTSNINSAQCFQVLLLWWLHPTAGVSNDRGSQLCFPLCVFSCSSLSSMLLVACVNACLRVAVVFPPQTSSQGGFIPNYVQMSSSTVPPPHPHPLLFISFRLKLSLNSCVCSSQSPASSQLEASSSSLGVFLLSVAASWRRLARRQWGGCGGAGGRGGSVHCVNVISLQAGCAWAEINRCMCPHTAGRSPLSRDSVALLQEAEKMWGGKMWCATATPFQNVHLCLLVEVRSDI